MKQVYVTKGVINEIPKELILLIRTLSIERLAFDCDYLQIFDLIPSEKNIMIRHRYEVPPYLREITVNKKHISIVNNNKLYVIDSEEYLTILLSEEY